MSQGRGHVSRAHCSHRWAAEASQGTQLTSRGAAILCHPPCSCHWVLPCHSHRDRGWPLPDKDSATLKTCPGPPSPLSTSAQVLVTMFYMMCHYTHSSRWCLRLTTEPPSTRQDTDPAGSSEPGLGGSARPYGVVITHALACERPESRDPAGV